MDKNGIIAGGIVATITGVLYMVGKKRSERKHKEWLENEKARIDREVDDLFKPAFEALEELNNSLDNDIQKSISSLEKEVQECRDNGDKEGEKVRREILLKMIELQSIRIDEEP